MGVHCHIVWDEKLKSENGCHMGPLSLSLRLISHGYIYMRVYTYMHINGIMHRLKIMCTFPSLTLNRVERSCM